MIELNLMRLGVSVLSTAMLLGGCLAPDGAVASSDPVPVSPITVPTLSKPNIIIILTDDQGYADVGFNGSKDIPTPHIDRIANEGVRFDRGYVSFPVCGPSRAGLLTGRYQSRFGYDLNSSEDPTNPRAGLPLSENTIADVLKPEGYTNGILGKWHMGNHPIFHPHERGFDEFFGFTNGGHNYFADRYNDIAVADAKSSGQLYNTKLMLGTEQIETSGYLTDLLSDAAVDFVTRNKDELFFLYLAYNAPHAPMQAPPRYTDRFPDIEDPTRKIYAGMIAAVDDGVGEILDTLKAQGIDDNTLVFFLSDNGGPLKRAKNGSINKPLRGGKGDLFEGGVRVPFAARWPGQIPAGIDYPHVVSALDIMATAAELAGADIDNDKPLDGVNLIPYLNEPAFKTVPHQRLFWRYRENSQDDNSYPRVGMVEGTSKYVKYGRNEMLFNLEGDKGENDNLKDDDKKRHKRLKAAQQEWSDKMMDQQVPIWNTWSSPNTPNKR